MARVSDNFLKLTLCGFNVINVLAAVLLIIAGSLAIPEVGQTDRKHDNLTFAIILIVAGLLVFGVTALACLGSIRDSFALLITFAVGLLVVALFELAAIIMAAVLASDTEKNLKTDMFMAMGYYSQRESSRDFMDTTQRRHKCCGADGYNDWILDDQIVPESCCYGAENTKLEVTHRICKNYKNKYLYRDGCYAPLKDGLLRALHFIMYVGTVSCSIKIIGFGLAIWLAIKVRKYF